MKKIIVILLLSILVVGSILCSDLMHLISLITQSKSDEVISADPSVEVVDATTEPAETFAPIQQASYADSYTDPATDRTIDYHMYIPENATENMPLIIYLHGVGAVGANRLNEYNPLVSKAVEVYGEAYPFLILAPSSMGFKTWISRNMPERVKALVDHIVERYHVDRTKIIITGHSMGANGVFRQIELYGDFYSAAIPISAPSTSIIELEKCLDVPMWGFAGSKEYPYDQNMRDTFLKIEEMEGNVKFTILEGVEHKNTAYRTFLYDVFEWAIAQ